jgi:pyrroloquinoline quinone biosynthesis protein E
MLIDEFLLSLPRPQPSAGLAFYNSEREAALTLDPRKKANYEKYQASSRRTANVDYLPIKLDVENVSRCNFACKMCVVATWPKRQRSTDMSFESFKALIDDQYGLVEIKLNGLGEPTLQGDTFFEMIKYARSKRIWVRITTNSSLLHLNSNYKKLIDSDVCEIDISVDGHTKEVFEGIRVGSHFETVVKNCKTLNEYARSQGRHRTKMWTLVQQDNYLNLEHHVRLAAELGFKHAVFSLNLHGWGSDTLLEKNKKVTVDRLMTVERIESLMALAREVGITLTFWNVNSKFDTDTPANLCPWPFERAVVASDSKIVPCCMVADPNAFHFARDQADTTVSQIWNSDEYRDFRTAHLKGDIPAICKGCYK